MEDYDSCLMDFQKTKEFCNKNSLIEGFSQKMKQGGSMKKFLLALMLVLGLTSFCFAGQEPVALAEIGLDQLEGVAIYIPGDKSMALGARMEIARMGIPGVTNYKIVTMGMVAGATFLNEEEDSTHVIAGPDIGISIPAIVEWLGGEWPNQNLTASLTAALPFDVKDSKFKPAIVGALVRITW